MYVVKTVGDVFTSDVFELRFKGGENDVWGKLLATSIKVIIWAMSRLLFQGLEKCKELKGLVSLGLG